MQMVLLRARTGRCAWTRGCVTCMGSLQGILRLHLYKRVWLGVCVHQPDEVVLGIFKCPRCQASSSLCNAQFVCHLQCLPLYRSLSLPLCMHGSACASMCGCSPRKQHAPHGPGSSIILAIALAIIPESSCQPSNLQRRPGNGVGICYSAHIAQHLGTDQREKTGPTPEPPSPPILNTRTPLARAGALWNHTCRSSLGGEERQCNEQSQGNDLCGNF